MAYNCKLGNASAQVQAVALANALNNGYCRIYDNTGLTGQPVDADASLDSKVLLVEGRFGNPASSNVSQGVITFNTITFSPIANSGNAFMYRLYQSDSVTPLVQGSIGTNGLPSANDVYNMNINTVALVSNGNFSSNSFIHIVQK